jgi:hypothetical protein
MRFDLLLNGGHHIRRAEVYLLARGCAAGNQIRAHTLIGVILSAAKNLGLFWAAPNNDQRCFAALNMT